MPPPPVILLAGGFGRYSRTAGSRAATESEWGHLLLPEVLGKPVRDGTTSEVRALAGLLSRLDPRPVDAATAEIAVMLAGSRRLRAADAAHLATALVTGADRFVTNNRRDFPKSIKEIQIVYQDDLPASG